MDSQRGDRWAKWMSAEDLVQLSEEEEGGDGRPWSRARKRLKSGLPAVSPLSWEAIWGAAMESLRDPVNLALTCWMLLAGPACVAGTLLSLGLLDSALPDPRARSDAEEVCNQVVNALFCLASLIGFPLLCRHALLLWRWRPTDEVELRKAFCKQGKRKPNDRTHIALVVLWAQIACWATFAFTAIYWLWPRDTRPPGLAAAANAVSKVASVFSFLHLLLSPLSQDYDLVKEGDEAVARMLRRSNTFFQKCRQVMEAEWGGSVCPGCCDNPKVATLTCLFFPCMFGYNMERLGFGNRVVHTLSFLIVLFGPLLVFPLSAGTLRNMGHTESAVNHLGAFLAVLGLAYGGVWRIKMRETFHLPGSTLCCGSARATDVLTWVLCSPCALCQETRTTDAYDVEQESFYRLASIRRTPDGAREEAFPLVAAPEQDWGPGRVPQLVAPLEFVR